MADSRQKPAGQAGHEHEHESVLDAPEHIHGVQKRKETRGAKPRSECDSALDGKECIQGVDEHKKK